MDKRVYWAWGQVGFFFLTVIFFATAMGLTVAVGVGMILIGLFAANGIRIIPANPPTNGCLTYFGERQPVVLKEGLVYLPFAPVVFGLIPISVVRVNQDLVPENVRTGDLASLEIEAAVTWTPTNLLEYLNSGGEEGVKRILEDMAEEAIRQWAISFEGEGAWQKAIAANFQAAASIAAKIRGKELTLEDMRKLTQGNAAVAIENLGITLNRLNVGKMVVQGNLALAAEKMVVETAERDGEKVEFSHIRERIGELVSTGLSPEQAMELIQSERGKIKKEVNQNTYGVTKDLKDLLDAAIKQALEKLFPEKKGGES